MSTDETNEPTRVRASDAERERVAEDLRNAVADGRLSLEEGDERLASLYRTRYRDELPVFTADLPAESGGGPGVTGPGATGPGGAGSGWGGAGWTGPGSVRPGASPRWSRRARALRGVPFVLVIPAIVIVAALTGHVFWPIFPILFFFFAFRLGAWRHGAYHWHHRIPGAYGPGGHGPGGYGPGGYGPGGYGPGGYGWRGYGPGYGPDYRPDYGSQTQERSGSGSTRNAGASGEPTNREGGTA